MVVGRSEVGKGKGLSRLIFKLGFSMVLYFRVVWQEGKGKETLDFWMRQWDCSAHNFFFFSEKSG